MSRNGRLSPVAGVSLPDEAEVKRRLTQISDSVARGELQLFGESGGDAVELAEPAADWPAEFARLRERLRRALGSAALRIDHVGSTAVPGIHAKPVIDIQVSVPDIDDEASFVPQIEALGWPVRSREPHHRHVYFRDPAGAPRRVHIHVCEAGSRWERDHLLFRDYLRAHPDRARDYEALKRAAQARYGNDRLAYTEAKGPFIEETLALAEQWAAQTAWQP